MKSLSQFDSITKKLIIFRDERNWNKYHTPRNLATSIAIEAAEILELFQWQTDEKYSLSPTDLNALEEELADVMIYCFLLAKECNFDLYGAIMEKIEKNALKYPKEKI